MIAQIQPVLWKHNSPTSASQLEVRSIFDDLHSQCVLLWKLEDSIGTIQDKGNYYITGSDYQSWTGDNTYPMTFTANQLEVSLISGSIS